MRHQRCWTYSHHCQIADMKPLQGSWNGEFRGFRICVGWISATRFCVVGFMYPIKISLFCVYSVTIYIARAITPRAITPLPPLPGYHAEGYHAPYLPPRAITPVYTSRLPHQSYHAPPIHVHRVITPAMSNSYFCSLPFAGFYATCTSPPTPPPGATRYILLHTLASSIERVGRAFLGADEEN